MGIIFCNIFPTFFHPQTWHILGSNSMTVATLTWSSVGVKPNTWKSGDLESSETPECSELDSKGQNTSHWDVLAVWLPTTKSLESTSSRCPIRECDMALERSRRGLQLWFRPRRNPTPQSGVMAVQSSGSPVGTISGQFRDSISGVPGICAIRMPPPRRGAENTIGSKVVAYSRVRAVVSLVCPSARGKSQHLRVSRMLN
jgi:hypothetical protein